MPPNMTLEIKEGAIFVADAHYASYRPTLMMLLERIEQNEISTPQLILMGDNFDLLMGGIAVFEKREAAITALLNRLSQKIEVILFEGNHDFNVAKIFSDALVIPLQRQPIEARYKEQVILLSHGDWNEGFGYKLYCAVVRSPKVLAFLNLFDTICFHQISRYFIKKMQKKSLCCKFENFEEKSRARLSNLSKKYDWIIEGHFHQGDIFTIERTKYHNLDAMACNKSYFVVQSKHNALHLMQKAV